MSTDGSLTILGLIGIIHIFVAILTTVELKHHPALSLFKNILWFFIIWLLPFVGAVMFYKNITLNSGFTQNTGNDSFSGGDYGDGD